MRGPKTILKWQKYSDVSDGMGGQVRTWADQGYLSGLFWTINGVENVMFSKITEDISHMFVSQFLPSGDKPLPRDRFVSVDGTRIFDIKFVDDMPDRANWNRCMLRELIT